MNRKLTASALIVISGIALAFAVVPLLGRTMAIASPAGYYEPFRAIGSMELASFVWDFAVVGMLGAGIAVFLACLVALRVAPTSRFFTLATFVAGFLVGGYILVPLLYGQAEDIASITLGRAWWAYGIDLSVLFSAAAAAVVHSWRSRRRNGR